MNSQKVVFLFFVFFCFQTVTRINSAGTAEPDRRGKPVAGGEWNPLPRDHGQIASPTFLLNKHHPHCHNHALQLDLVMSIVITVLNRTTSYKIIVIVTRSFLLPCSPLY